jgi:hypothetical protein
VSKSGWFVAALAGALAGGAIAVAGVGAAGTSSALAPLTLTIAIDPSSVHSMDLAPKGPSSGDVNVYSGTIRRSGRVAGRVEGESTDADEKYEGNISSQYLVLADGTVAIAGGGQSGAPGVGRPDSKIYDAIVGGTGRYAGEGGWVSEKDISESVEQMTLHFTR